MNYARSRPPMEQEAIGLSGLDRLGEIDDLGNVGEVVAGEGDDVRPPLRDEAMIRRVALHLQIDQPHIVTRAARRFRNELKAERLEFGERLGVKQRTGGRTNKSRIADPPRDWTSAGRQAAWCPLKH